MSTLDCSKMLLFMTISCWLFDEYQILHRPCHLVSLLLKCLLPGERDWLNMLDETTKR
jgi:hypothetical protein